MRFSVLWLGLTASLYMGPALADVCVWRDPERTMARLFPEARDYKTVTYKLTPEQAEHVGAFAGQPLTPDEAQEYSIYEITDGKQVIGEVLALAGAGEYGAIEAVIGVDPHGSVRGVYLQRIRERQSDALKSKAFLQQFEGRSLERLNVQGPAVAEQSGQVIVQLVRKMLAYERVLRQSAKP